MIAAEAPMKALPFSLNQPIPFRCNAFLSSAEGVPKFLANTKLSAYSNKISSSYTKSASSLQIGKDSRMADASALTPQAWNAKEYRKNCAFVPELGLPVLKLLNSKPGERVLDLGCGDGTLSRKLMQLGCYVVGVDSSKDMVSLAQKDGVDARVMDGHMLHFGPEFDAVFSNAALHWMKKDPNAVIAGVARSLKPGGRFVGEFGGFGNVAAIKTALLAVLKERGIDCASRVPWYFPSASEYRSRLVSHGFHVESMELIPRPTLLPAGMCSWFDTFCDSFFEGLTSSEKAEVKAVAEDLLRHSLFDASDGVWYADYVRLRFAAKWTDEDARV